MPDGHCLSILLFCCSGGGPRQPWPSGLAPVSRFHCSIPLSYSSPSLIGHSETFCFTSTEARLLIRDGDRGRESEGSTADTDRKRSERPWTAARTMELLRRCPLAIAQRLEHYSIAVSTASRSYWQSARVTRACLF